MSERNANPMPPTNRRRRGHLPRWTCLLLIAFLPLAAAAQSSEEQKGLAISREADRRDLGFGDSVASIAMILKNANGQTSTRELNLKTLEVPDEGDGDKILSVIASPPDVRGTALLTYTHINEQDDQWLYLPALKRVKRISSANKSGPFLGSEFAYEDLASQEVAKYTHRYLRDEPCGELHCFVIERVPVYRHSGYTRQLTWIDHDEYRFWKVDFYDRKNDLLKTLTFSDYRQYLDQYWRALVLDMHNHQTGKSTRLSYTDLRFRVGLTDSDFTRNALQRAR
jgi:outer membrane lipoprotein-sorting protein